MKKVKGKILNVWNKVRLYCGRHEEPVEMLLISNAERMKEPYYVCPCEDCSNADYAQRISLIDFEKIDDALEEKMSKCGVQFDMTNCRFEVKRTEPQKNIRAKVISHSGKIKISIE